MYCKNCGRKLEEGTRFCDRCGQSVRQSRGSGKEAKEREIQELKEERLNRQKLLAQKEERQSIKKKARKKRSGVLIFFAAVLLIMLASALAAYFIYSSNESTISGDGAVSMNTPTTAPNDDATPAPTAMPTAIPSSNSSNRSSNEGKEIISADNKDYKKIFVTDDIEFSYPSVFTKTASDEEYAVLGLKDSAGGAEITVYESEYPGGTASELMKSYASKLGGSIEYSRAGDDWYVITVFKNNDVYHRKYIFTEDDSVVYYDFTYPSLSSYADEYEEYIKYIDEALSL